MRRLGRVLLAAGLALAVSASPVGAQDAEPAYGNLLAALKRPYLSVGVLLQTVGDFQIERSRAGHNG